VEATKFTEVGYVGKDVETIIRDLADAVKMVREKAKAGVRAQAEANAEERMLDALLPPPARRCEEDSRGVEAFRRLQRHPREVPRQKLREGKLDEREIELEVSASPIGVEIMAPPGMEEMTSQLQGMFQNHGRAEIAEAQAAQAEGATP
jgi:ATP-dependent HslUV protease ATP-binding subunit HslU